MSVNQLTAPASQTAPVLQTNVLVRRRLHTLDWGLVVVVSAAAAMAVLAYLRYLPIHDHLWISSSHDRHAHYCSGLSMALDLRRFDLAAFAHDFNRSRVWGPLHGVLIAGLQTLGGPDIRLAVLPSLAGWFGVAVFGFLAARRMVTHGRNLAGLVAAVFILGSPAHQAYATDIMLESMGACLSVLALYLYLVTVQDKTAVAARLLALTLTLLFLFKYNYWLLALFAVVATELTQRPGQYWQLAVSVFANHSWKRFLVQQLRHPLTYVIAVLAAAVTAVIFTGGGVYHFAGQRISITSPHNLAHALYIVLFLRLTQWWWQQGRHNAAMLPAQGRQFLYWHMWPIAVWFLLPKRLGYFVWFLSPANSSRREVDFLGGLPEYWSWLARDYHLAYWGVGLALGLTIVALLMHRYSRQGAAVLLWFVIISAILTAQHPNRKSRYLHSWLPGMWILAGAGAAGLLYGARSGGLRSWRTGVAIAGVTGLAVLHWPAVGSGGHAPVGGPVPERPSILPVANRYLPELDGAKRPMIISNQPIHWLVEWTYVAQYPQQRRPEFNIKNYGKDPHASPRDMFQHWLKTTRCDHVVYVHIPKGTRFHEFHDYPMQGQLRQLLLEQRVFTLTNRWELPEFGIVIYHWEKL